MKFWGAENGTSYWAGRGGSAALASGIHATTAQAATMGSPLMRLSRRTTCQLFTMGTARGMRSAMIRFASTAAGKSGSPSTAIRGSVQMIGVVMSIRRTPSGSTPCHPGATSAKAPPRVPMVSHDRLASKS